VLQAFELVAIIRALDTQPRALLLARSRLERGDTAAVLSDPR
jgi:hypothetical protein